MKDMCTGTYCRATSELLTVHQEEDHGFQTAVDCKKVVEREAEALGKCR